MKKWLLVATVSMLAACNFDDRKTFQGYIENNLSYIASPLGGRLEVLSVDRGTPVLKDAALFTLAQEPESDDVAAAIANVDAALATVMDLSKGARPEKLDQLKAQIVQAQADLMYDKKEWLRRKELVASDNIQIDLFDQSTRDVEKSTALLNQYQATLAEAELPARIDQIDAARASLRAANASLKKATWMLAQKTVRAPQNGFVFDTYYNLGEYVPSAVAVVSLLIPNKTKAIVFVPESELSRLTLGGMSTLTCDQCKSSVTGKISFISPTAEYTPPVIYSRDNRLKLVYRIEISFEESVAATLHPGQPVDVTL